MGLAERHILVDFKMLFDVQAVVEFLHADLMDGEVAARSDGADSVVDRLGDGRGRDSVNDDVGAGKMPLHGFSRGHGELFGALEGEIARHAERDIGEEVGAGAACAQAIHGHHAGNCGEVVDEVAAKLFLSLRAVAGWIGGRGCVEQRVNRLARETPTNAEDDSGDHERCDRVSVFEPGQRVAIARVTGGEAEHDGERGPDVGGEVDRVRGEGVGTVLASDAPERARTGVVNRDGAEQDDERRDGRASAR